MFYTSDGMRDICYRFAEDMTISQLCRVMKIRGINADSLTVSEIVGTVSSDEYAEVLLSIASESGWYDNDIHLHSCEVADDTHFDIYWREVGPEPDDKVIHLIAQIVESGYLVPLQAICDDLQIAISVW